MSRRPHLAWAVLLVALPGGSLSAQTSISGQVVRAGRGLADAAVYLVPVEGPAPEVEALPRQSIDQIHLSFVPQVLVVTPGTEVSFMNSDPLLHNVFSPGADGHQPFDLGTYPAGLAETNRFAAEGIRTLLCHIHPEMVAYVLVTRAPHRAVTGTGGSFTLSGVPAGSYEAHVWHPRMRNGPRVFPLEVGAAGVTGLRFEVLR